MSMSKDEGRAQTALEKLQGGGGSMWLKFLTEAYGRRQRHVPCFKVHSTKHLELGRMGRAKGLKLRGNVVLISLGGSQSPTCPLT